MLGEPEIFKSGLHFLSNLENVPRWCESHNDIIYDILLSSKYTWQSLNLTVVIEIKIRHLVLVLFLICRMHVCHVAKGMMLSITFFVKVYHWCKFKLYTLCKNWDSWIIEVLSPMCDKIVCMVTFWLKYGRPWLSLVAFRSKRCLMRQHNLSHTYYPWQLEGPGDV